MSDTTPLPIQHDTTQRQFEIDLGDQSAVLSYAERGEDTLDFVHTYVPQSHRGQGIAGKIVAHALDYARDQGKKVIPSCPYVKHYVQRHEEYADLVK